MSIKRHGISCRMLSRVSKSSKTSSAHFTDQDTKIKFPRAERPARNTLVDQRRDMWHLNANIALWNEMKNRPSRQKRVLPLSRAISNSRKFARESARFSSLSFFFFFCCILPSSFRKRLPSSFFHERGGERQNVRPTDRPTDRPVGFLGNDSANFAKIE